MLLGDLSRLEMCMSSLFLPSENVESSDIVGTARSVEDETRNDRRNANRNSEWWGDFSQLQI